MFFLFFYVGKKCAREKERDINRERIHDEFHFIFIEEQEEDDYLWINIFFFINCLILLKKSSWICGIFTHSSLLFSFSTAKHQVNTFIYHTSKMIHWKLTYMVGVVIKCCWTEESGIIDCSLWKKNSTKSLSYIRKW